MVTSRTACGECREGDRQWGSWPVIWSLPSPPLEEAFKCVCGGGGTEVEG